MKILFTIKCLNIQIVDSLRWVGQGTPRIIDMSDNHIHSVRLWLYNAINAEKAVYGQCPKHGEFTYPVWAKVFEAEEERRNTIKLAAIESKKQKLQQEIDKLNELTVTDITYKHVEKECVKSSGGSRREWDSTDDHALQAFESALASYGY